MTSATWSGGATLPSGLAAVLAGALSTTVSEARVPARLPSRSARVTVRSISSLPAQTLTITYDVTVTDNNGVSSTQPVTVTDPRD